MYDYRTFDSEESANACIAGMRGWKAQAVRLYLPSGGAADDDEPKHVWVIHCDDDYLRDDGYVR